MTPAEIKETVLRYHPDAKVVSDNTHRYVVASTPNLQAKTIGTANYFDPPDEEWMSAFRNTLVTEVHFCEFGFA